MKHRETWVDYAKAIGIILVVYGHVARGLYNGGIDFPVSYFELFDSIIYSFHMPLFFFLSGLFFYNSFSRQGGIKLVFTKVDTIFYPYVIWSLLQGSVEVILSNYTNGNLAFSEVFSLLWAPRAQFWFLYALFSIFALASIIYALISKRFTMLIFACSIALYLYSSQLPQFFLLWFISNSVVFFLLGIMFTMYLKPELLSSWVALIALSFAFVSGQWVFHDYFAYKFTNKGFGSLLLACISIAFVVSLSLRLSRHKYQYLTYIGTCSMAIYLMHILAGSGSRVILSKLLGIDSVVIHLISGCFIGIFLPLLAVFLIDRFNIKYLLSAPISTWLTHIYNKLLSRPTESHPLK